MEDCGGPDANVYEGRKICNYAQYRHRIHTIGTISGGVCFTETEGAGGLCLSQMTSTPFDSSIAYVRCCLDT